MHKSAMEKGQLQSSFLEKIKVLCEKPHNGEQLSQSKYSNWSSAKQAGWGGEEVVSKANLQIVDTDWKTIQADLINRYMLTLCLLQYPIFQHWTATLFYQKTVCACLLVDVQLSNCSTGTSHTLTVALHLQIGRRLKHIYPSSQHI